MSLYKGRPPPLKHHATKTYLQALDQQEASLDMLAEIPPYEEMASVEHALKSEGKLELKHIFQEVTGYYFFLIYLISEYEAEKAIFVKDVDHYRSMRYESARRRVAHLLYERFVAEQDESEKNLNLPEDLIFKSSFEILLRRDRERRAKRQQSPSAASAAGAANAAEAAGSPSPSNSEEQKPEEKPHEESSDEDESSGEVGVELSRLPVQHDESTSLHIGSVNAIGVYGPPIAKVRKTLEEGKAPADLFAELKEQVWQDLTLDVCPRFLKSPYYRKYIQSKRMETLPVSMKDFEIFRILGRGGFGAVYAARKLNSGALYAIKLINKRQVARQRALVNIMAERDVLTKVNSPRCTRLMYAFQDEEFLYLVMDLLLGGDLKYHLIHGGKFGEKRARYYAAELVLALEHLHSRHVVYRDIKLENVMLDLQGHATLVDLGLAVILDAADTPIKGYAGTPGYCAPEMVADKSYSYSVDYFSFGVLLFRMLGSSKPFRGRNAEELDRAVLKKSVDFSNTVFSPVAVDLLSKLLEKDPAKRLGAHSGWDEVKEHPFFQTIDWGLLEAGYIDPPFKPSQKLNAPTQDDIGHFDEDLLRDVVLDRHFKRTVEKFDYINPRAVQDELVAVLEKTHKGIDLRKFSSEEKRGSMASESAPAHSGSSSAPPREGSGIMQHVMRPFRSGSSEMAHNTEEKPDSGTEHRRGSRVIRAITLGKRDECLLM